MTLSQNAFNLQVVAGQLMDGNANRVFSCLVDSSETGTVVAGNAVVVADVSAPTINVVKTSANTDTPSGFAVYSIKNGDTGFVAGQPLQVAMNQAVMYMTASAAIAANADVEYDPSTNKVATKNTGAKIGKAIDKATADGDIIRVEIQTGL